MQTGTDTTLSFGSGDLNLKITISDLDTSNEVSAKIHLFEDSEGVEHFSKQVHQCVTGLITDLGVKSGRKT